MSDVLDKDTYDYYFSEFLRNITNILSAGSFPIISDALESGSEIFNGKLLSTYSGVSLYDDGEYLYSFSNFSKFLVRIIADDWSVSSLSFVRSDRTAEDLITFYDCESLDSILEKLDAFVRWVMVFET